MVFRFVVTCCLFWPITLAVLAVPVLLVRQFVLLFQLLF
jgi:hypothetical protein